jgi:hypothetical protein
VPQPLVDEFVYNPAELIAIFQDIRLLFGDGSYPARDWTMANGGPLMKKGKMLKILFVLTFRHL